MYVDNQGVNGRILDLRRHAVALGPKRHEHQQQAQFGHCTGAVHGYAFAADAARYGRELFDENLTTNLNTYRCPAFDCPDDLPSNDLGGTSAISNPVNLSSNTTDTTSTDTTGSRPDNQSYFQWQGLGSYLQTRTE